MGIHQALIGSYAPSSTPPASLWTVPFSAFVEESLPYTISNLQVGDLVFFASVEDNEDQLPIPGWTYLTSGFSNPKIQISCRKAIVDTSFTIPSSWATDSSDNYAAVVVRSTKNTITLLDPGAISESNVGFCRIPEENLGTQPLPSLTNDPFTLALGFYADDDVTSSSAPTSDWTYLGLTNDGATTIVGAYSLEASSGDSAPPGADNSFGNPTNGSANNSCFVSYASAEDRTVKTWSIVDSVFQDLEADGRNLTLNNLQQGDLVYWTQVGDSAGSISTQSGWFSTFEDNSNLPSFKEQVLSVDVGVTSISVTCSTSCEAGALIAFRCFAASEVIDSVLESSAYAITTGSTGSPVVPDQHSGTLGTNLPLTSQDDCLCVVTGYMDDDTISSCTAPTGLNLAGFVGASGFFGTRQSSLMIAYGVSLKDEAAPLAGGRAFTTDGSDSWTCSAWYLNPYES